MVGQTYGAAFTAIRNALGAKGYPAADHGWFLVPGGFVVTLPMERMLPNGGIPANGRHDLSPRPAGSSDLGRYRSFSIFFGTAVTQSDDPLKWPTVQDFLDTDDQPLPNSVRNRSVGEGEFLKVFIYEYGRNGRFEWPRLQVNLSASIHLSKTGLAAGLQGVCET